MFKTLLIGIKDLKLAFRDRAALVFMLLAPFLLTLGMGLVTGQFSGRSSGISDIPVVIVNQDEGELGQALVDIFNSEDLAELVEPSPDASPEAARQLVDEDEAAAAIIIPKGFTESIIPKQEDLESGITPETVMIEMYANPTRPTSAGIIKSILDEYMSRIEEGSLGVQTSVIQMFVSGRMSPEQAEAASEEIGKRQQITSDDDILAIALNTSTAAGDEVEFNALAYLAPAMALMFLMFTVSNGGRTILAEKSQGTLPRMLVSPTNAVQILGGKVFGIFLTGAAQMFILIGGTSLLFQLKWGDTVGVVVLVLAAVFGATGWGMLVTALARSPAQVGSVGSALMLIFGILGGSFIQLDQMPPLIQSLSRITPNSWALDGFTTLALGGTLAALSTPITALLAMGGVLFVISVFLFGRKNLVQK